MAGKVTVIAYHRAKPGQEQALRDALLAVCAPTRAEEGLPQLRSPRLA
jgi:quinol monooxygenase YgiN